MPVAYEILPEHHLIWITAWGVLTTQELLDARSALAQDPRFQKSLAQFMDYRDVTSFDGTTTDVRGLAASNPFAPESRRVVVAGADAAFGMARMYQMMLEGGDDSLLVCRDLDEGFKWLGLAGDQAAILENLPNTNGAAANVIGSEVQAARILRAHFEGLFPRVCSSCGTRYDTLRQWASGTHPIKGAMSYDVEAGDWAPAQPIGTFVLTNCPCGSTISLTTDGLPLPYRHALLAWVKSESARRGVTPAVLIEHLRDEIRAQVLSDNHHSS